MKLTYFTDNYRHLVCFPFSIENLHSMAKDLGIKRNWFHNHKYPHYDIPKSRVAEITSKSNLVSSKFILNIIKRVDFMENFKTLVLTRKRISDLVDSISSSPIGGKFFEWRGVKATNHMINGFFISPNDGGLYMKVSEFESSKPIYNEYIFVRIYLGSGGKEVEGNELIGWDLIHNSSIEGLGRYGEMLMAWQSNFKNHSFTSMEQQS